MKISTNEEIKNEICVSNYVTAMEIRNGTQRKTQVYSFARYGNNYSEPGQAVAEILWNAFGPGKATCVWVEYHDGYLRIFNNGIPVDLNDVFQYGISTHASEMSSFGTGTTNVAGYLNPSNKNFGVNTKTRGKYLGIRAPFSETMMVGEISDSEIEIMKKVSDKVTTEFFVHDENNLLVNFNFKRRIGEMCALMIKNGKKVYFNGELIDPVIYDCGALGRRSPRWEHETLVTTEHGNFVLQYININCSEDKMKSQDTNGVWLYFNGMLLGHKGVGLFKNLSRGKGSKNSYLQSHNCFNNLRTIVNIVTEGVDGALKIPFVNTKANIQWNANSAKAIREEIDARIGAKYREIKLCSSEAGKRKCIDYIGKKFAWASGMHYQTEVRLGDSNLTCDAIIYDGEPFSEENVRSGKTIIKSIVEFKRANVNTNHINQVFGYVIQALPVEKLESKEIEIPRIVFVGRDVCKHFEESINKFNSWLRVPLEYEFIRYEECAKLTDDN